MNQRLTLDSRWRKAALLGSIWASVEIVIGSFLHNIKFPFTGTILSGIGVALLVAGNLVWQEKGIIWRAGIICAIMKSVSPSIVILGPMIGITLEAFIVELTIRLIGSNTVSYILGGAIACTLPMIQKAVSYILMYGTNIAVVFDRLVEFSSGILRIESLQSLDVIAAILIVNFIFGASAAIAGMIIGKRALNISSESQKVELPGHNHFKSYLISERKFSIPLLLLNITVLVTGLISESAVFLLYVPFCLFRYNQVRIRFQKVRFWVEAALISVLSGIIITGLAIGSGGQGFIIGLEMFSRAVFVVTVFTSISAELRNPEIIQVLFQKRMRNLHSALDAAFSALPVMIESLQKEKYFLKHPVNSLSRVFSSIASFPDEDFYKPDIIILTGEKSRGKTTLLKSVTDRMKSEGKAVGGILQPVVWEKDQRAGYDIYDISSEKKIPLCRTYAQGNNVAGPFKFYEEGLKLGKDILQNKSLIMYDIIVIDEVGPLEISGAGWADSLSEILDQFSGILILVIRSSLLDKIIKKFNISHVPLRNIIDIEEKEKWSLIFSGCSEKEELNRIKFTG